MRVVIPLSDASSDALRRLASEEFRDPRMQAKLILERALLERDKGADGLEAEKAEPAMAVGS
jgi:hypothetical protein